MHAQRIIFLWKIRKRNAVHKRLYFKRWILNKKCPKLNVFIAGRYRGSFGGFSSVLNFECWMYPVNTLIKTDSVPPFVYWKQHTHTKSWFNMMIIIVPIINTKNNNFTRFLVHSLGYIAHAHDFTECLSSRGFLDVRITFYPHYFIVFICCLFKKSLLYTMLLNIC